MENVDFNAKGIEFRESNPRRLSNCVKIRWGSDLQGGVRN